MTKPLSEEVQSQCVPRKQEQPEFRKIDIFTIIMFFAIVYLAFVCVGV